MSKLLKWLGCGLCAVFVLAVCAPAYAVSIYSAPFAPNPGVGASYGPYPWDYQSLPDVSGYKENVPTNILASVGTAMPGFSLGSGPPTTIGLAQAFTPRAGSEYGAKNDHGFKLNLIAVPLAGGNPHLVGSNGVTLKIYQPTFSGSGLNSADSSFPDGAAGNPLFSTTFDWSNDGSAKMMYFNLEGAGPTLSIDTTYALAFEWTETSTNNGTDGLPTYYSFFWYRLADSSTADATNSGPTIVPSGQGYRLRNSVTEDYLTIFASGGSSSAPRTFAMALSSVPEPATLVLTACGLPAVLIAARRRMRRQ